MQTPGPRTPFATFNGSVHTQGDMGAARILAGLFQLDAELSRGLTHGFHAYAGRMPPSLARGAIAAFSQPGDVIVDPFCGSGTVPVEAMVAGRAVRGTDLSPLAVALARVRTTVMDDAARQRLVDAAASIGHASSEKARARVRPDVPVWARDEFRRFDPHVALELFGLRAEIVQTDTDAIGRALRMCLSSILVKLRRDPRGAMSDPDALERPLRRFARGFASRLFADRAVELAAGLRALASVTPPETPLPRISEGDARDVACVGDGAAGLIVSSPPYAGIYDYADDHDVRFRWLGLTREHLDEGQIGRRGTTPAGVQAGPWNTARRQWMGEMSRMLRPGGHVVLVVGDGVVGGAAEDACEAVAAVGPSVGLEPIAVASQERPTVDRELRTIFFKMRRSEHICLLRKK